MRAPEVDYPPNEHDSRDIGENHLVFNESGHDSERSSSDRRDERRLDSDDDLSHDRASENRLHSGDHPSPDRQGELAVTPRRRGEPHAVRAERPRQRYIPVHVRRQVYERDGGRCAYVAADGQRCRETSRSGRDVG